MEVADDAEGSVLLGVVDVDCVLGGDCVDYSVWKAEGRHGTSWWRRSGRTLLWFESLPR